ncbi:MAG: hypothetical protein OXI08_00180 [Cyanobacteria bacterium MAG IRC4_bin_6]|nr:hypothetical protein [Cyanobacteria bacterium MAG IRC4_bin_6]
MGPTTILLIPSKKQDAAGLVRFAEAAHKKWQSVRKHNAARVFLVALLVQQNRKTTT